MMQGDLLPIAEKIYPKDVLKRAKGLWEEIGSVGAYSPSKGLLGIRKRVAKFLEGESISAASHLPPGRSIIPSSLGRIPFSAARLPPTWV